MLKSFIEAIIDSLKFKEIQKKKNEIIFYSEGSHDTIYFEEIIKILVNKYSKNIIILTSDRNDICYKLKSENINVFYIGFGLLRTLIFFLIKSELFITSLPDIESYYLKRSRVHKTKYIYIFHSVNSTNACYNKRAFDNYDYIFCRGKHHTSEILENEEINNLKKKILIEHGCPIFDTLIKNLRKNNSSIKNILIAPSWNKYNELIDLNLEKLINELYLNNFNVTIRFHPMTVRKKLSKIKKLETRFKNIKNIKFASKMEDKDDLYTNDILITDWSGICWEFSLMLGKPTIFINTPMKIMNKDYYKFKNKALEIEIREKIGFLFNTNEYQKLIEKLNSPDFLNQFNNKIKNIEYYREFMFFNHGQSSNIAASEIINILEKRK